MPESHADDGEGAGADHHEGDVVIRTGVGGKHFSSLIAAGCAAEQDWHHCQHDRDDYIHGGRAFVAGDDQQAGFGAGQHGRQVVSVDG